MPAKTQAQKRLMCMALAYKRHGKSALKAVKNKEQVIKLAETMSEEDLRDYCLSPVKK